jgi:hypothetical protein
MLPRSGRPYETQGQVQRCPVTIAPTPRQQVRTARAAEPVDRLRVITNNASIALVDWPD